MRQRLMLGQMPLTRVITSAIFARAAADVRAAEEEFAPEEEEFLSPPEEAELLLLEEDDLSFLLLLVEVPSNIKSVGAGQASSTTNVMQQGRGEVAMEIAFQSTAAKWLIVPTRTVRVSGADPDPSLTLGSTAETSVNLTLGIAKMQLMLMMRTSWGMSLATMTAK